MAYQKNRLGYLLAGWRPPVGLRHSRPRDVAYTGSGWVLAMCILLLLGGGLVALAGLGSKVHREATEAKLLREQGVETSGWITRLWRGKGDSKQPYAAFEFEAGGRKYQGRAKVRLPYWRQLQLGGEWKIRYVPADPRVHHPVHMTPSVTPAFVPYLVGGLCLLGGLLVWAVLRRESRLLAEGRIAPAVVTKVRDTKSEASIMHYEFPLFSGGVGNGKAMTNSKTTHVGEHVCVVYLPDEPRRNALYPLTLVKPAGYLPEERAPKRGAGRQARHAHRRAAVVIPG